MAQWLETRLPIQEMWVQSLGQENPLEKAMTAHSNILAGKSQDRGAWWPTVHGVTKELNMT